MATADPLEVANIVREVAAAEIMPRWRNLAAGDVATKSRAGDLVTVADHAAELALARRLEALLPGSCVVGEEAVAADPAVLRRLCAPGPVWVLDPIDGTRKFAAGEPTFDVMVALVVAGEPVLGCIYAPAEGTLFLGGDGAAEWQAADGAVQPIAAPRDSPLASLEGVLGPAGFASRGRPDPNGVRHHFRGYSRPICAGHNYGRLFKGESHFLVNFATHPWDHLPGLAIARAAGFRGARHDGAPFDPMDAAGGILVAPEASWDAIHAVLLGPR